VLALLRELGARIRLWQLANHRGKNQFVRLRPARSGARPYSGRILNHFNGCTGQSLQPLGVPSSKLASCHEHPARVPVGGIYFYDQLVNGEFLLFLSSNFMGRAYEQGKKLQIPVVFAECGQRRWGIWATVEQQGRPSLKTAANRKKHRCGPAVGSFINWWEINPNVGRVITLYCSG